LPIGGYRRKSGTFPENLRFRHILRGPLPIN
jgi:hypothetical protein